MLNIFNLFLFLFALWILFMIAAGTLSWLYVFFGILSASFVAVVSFRLKLIEEKSELLYLSLGFYRHFFQIFVKNFFSAIKFVISMALTNKPFHPIVYSLELSPENKFNPALLMASLNMTTGLFCIGTKEQEIFVHCIDDDHFKKFNLQKTYKFLKDINDDNLV